MSTSCSDMLDVDSEGLLFDKDHGMGNVSDTLYSMTGILSQVQKLSDRCVYFGELRGDLLTTTDKSDYYLQELNSFQNLSEDNPLLDTRDYYNVINHCNYVINNIDTAIIVNTTQALRKYYVAAKVMRAWTYFQLVQSYGEAVWYEQAITNVEGIDKIGEIIGFDDMVTKLINDLDQFREESQANLGSFGGYSTRNSFYPIKAFLGDLYLWRGSMTGSMSDYEQAALLYKEQINARSFLISGSSSYYIADTQYEFAENPSRILSLSNVQKDGSSMMFQIVTSKNYGYQTEIKGMNDSLELVPTKNLIESYDTLNYFTTHYCSSDPTTQLRLYQPVDLRKYLNLKYKTSSEQEYNYIYKYLNSDMSSNTDCWGTVTSDFNDYSIRTLGRGALLYMRYAEAMNQLGYPNIAMMVLKNGLNSTNINKFKLQNNTYLSGFENTKFDSNVGIRALSCGMAEEDETFNIPDYTRYKEVEDEKKPGTMITVACEEGDDDFNIARQASVYFMETLLLFESGRAFVFEEVCFVDMMR